MSLEEFK